MRVKEANRNYEDNEKKLQIKKEAKFKAPVYASSYKVMLRFFFILLYLFKFKCPFFYGANDRKEFEKIEKASVDNNLGTMLGTRPATIKVSTNNAINTDVSVEDHNVLS